VRIRHILIAVVLCVAALSPRILPAGALQKPNILFLLADDWAWPHASCLGDPVVKTPTFDRLAREGVMFRNAHCAAPSCSASRAAMLTGQWPWRLERGANLWSSLPVKFDVYPNLLQKAGYFIGLTGKGYGPGNDEGRPHNAAGPAFKSFAAFLAARPKGRPFCFWFGSHQPHRSYPRDCGVKHGLDPVKVVVPPYLPDNDIVRRDICDYYFQSEQFDRQAGECLAALEKTGELDNTLIVISGDNGWPFPRCKATLYDTGTHQPLAFSWRGHIPPGRVVDDFVSLADLAPTFLEIAGLPRPATMTARSLLSVLLSEKSGRIDPARDHVLTLMERHAPNGRADGGQGNVGYPMRSILTKEFHFIRNFRPGRWPAGDPPAGTMPDFDDLAKNTFAGFCDVDAGPSKAWILVHRDEPSVKPFYERAFDKHPARELYDLHKDPYELRSVAEDPKYAGMVKELENRLMTELNATGDPRATGGGDEFDRYEVRR
jgi:uncharacterized sulfatase